MGSKYIYVYTRRDHGVERMVIALALADIPDDVTKVDKYCYDHSYVRGDWEVAE